MTPSQHQSFRRLLMGGVILSGAAPVLAQTPGDAGVVRISDKLPAGVQPVSGAEVANCPTCQQNGYSGSYVSSGNYCPGGNCPPGHHGGLFHHHDQGFSVPVKQPIYRTPVAYQHWLRDNSAPAGYGGGPTAPIVYMPTDTTQLGYYYQHVPTWRPQPGRIPPTPYPAEWHRSLYGTLGHSHPHGVIWGTAPVMQPQQGAYCPPGTPINSAPDQGYAPTIAPLQPEQGVNGAGLDRADAAPKLLPISSLPQ